MIKKLLSIIYLFFAIIFNFQPLLAQNPGGIGVGNLRGWFKASTVTLTAGAVSSWTDLSGNGFHHTNGTPAQRPLQSNNIYNGNPALVFDGSNDNLSYSTGVMVAGATSSLSIFAVANLDGTGGDTWGTVFEGQSDATWASGGYGLAALSAANTSFGFFVRDWSTNFVTVSTAAAPISKGSILSGIWNGGANLGKVDYRWNGKSQGILNYAGTVGNNGTTSTIGGAPTSSYNFYGKIGEIIIYNTGLSTANINKVETYLAVKYGIALGGNGSAVNSYTSTSGTTIWNAGTGYHYDITALGAESTEGLQQNKSSSLNVPAAVGANDMPFTIAHDNIAAPTNIGDGTYIIAGHNNGNINGAVTSFTHGGATIKVVQNRVFRIQTTNLVGGKSMMNMSNLIVQFDMSKVPGLGGSFGLGAANASADIRLLLDDNTTFGQGTANEKSYSNSAVAGNLISFQIPVGDLPATGVYFMKLGSVNFGTAPLPIELLSFNAAPCSNKICLSWKTATEINNDYFTIEKSNDGINYESLSQIDGAGNSPSILNYSSEDTDPYNGISYYRLKQTDYNGANTWSNTVTVNFTETGDFSLEVFPNPNDGSSINVSLGSSKGKEVLVMVYDALGKEEYSKVIITGNNSDNVYAIDPSGKLTPGFYLITATSQQDIQSKRMIVK